MTKTATQGQCKACSSTFSKRSALKHFSSCRDLQTRLDKSPDKEDSFIIKVQSPYAASVYWMYLLLPKKIRLTKLDQFLRDTWLECCGHLSAFTIGGTAYSSSPEDEESMNIACNRILSPKLKFRHEYDFGSTTELDLEVVSECETTPQKDVTLLMKNNPPEYPCDGCKKAATCICTQCGEHLCKACISSHDCVEEENDDYMISLLPNSPRAGVCGY